MDWDKEVWFGGILRRLTLFFLVIFQSRLGFQQVVHFPFSKKYKESLGLPQKLVIGYQAHADTATKSNSITKNKFVV